MFTLGQQQLIQNKYRAHLINEGIESHAALLKEKHNVTNKLWRLKQHDDLGTMTEDRKRKKAYLQLQIEVLDGLIRPYTGIRQPRWTEERTIRTLKRNHPWMDEMTIGEYLTIEGAAERRSFIKKLQYQRKIDGKS